MQTFLAEHRVRAGAALRQGLSRVHMLAFLPAGVLAAFWLGGETLLMTVAFGLPLALAFTGAGAPIPAGSDAAGTARRSIIEISEAEALCDALLNASRLSDLSAGALAIEIGGLDPSAEGVDDRDLEHLRDVCLVRLRTNLRAADQAFRIGDKRFLVILEPTRRLDTEAMLEAANRLQAALEDPLAVRDARHAQTAAIGICTVSRLPADARGRALLDASLDALAEAVSVGPSAIRIWSEGLGATRTFRRVLRGDVAHALGSGQIRPWFQPQICTSTGAITGAEALARWIHPKRGMIAPIQFLDALEAGGHMGHLAERMLRDALATLAAWDRAGLGIPRVSVNVSGAELRDPTFVERLKWDLDRQNMAGDRLGIEVLETVFTDGPDPRVSTTIAALKRLGCHIDLDDFGTGHASIMALHRLPIDRVKIDRGFIAGIDLNEKQRRMVAGILSLAEQLGMQTLAEGVESAGEHALLAQLGCEHVQGFRIARPMPADQIPAWVARHRQSIVTPGLSRRAR